MTTQEDPQDPQEDPMVGICTMCKGPIHEVRLKVAPHVLTCSALCARERDLWRKRQAAKRARQRKKDANAAKAGGSGGPVSTHEPASCVAAVCPLCEAYENGYVVGKSKAHNEVRAQTLDDTHGRGCGCEPCRTVWIVRKAVLDELAVEPVLLPDHHLQDCAGPGCGASCACWCHAALRS